MTLRNSPFTRSRRRTQPSAALGATDAALGSRSSGIILGFGRRPHRTGAPRLAAEGPSRFGSLCLRGQEAGRDGARLQD